MAWKRRASDPGAGLLSKVAAASRLPPPTHTRYIRLLCCQAPTHHRSKQHQSHCHCWRNEELFIHKHPLRMAAPAQRLRRPGFSAQVAALYDARLAPNIADRGDDGSRRRGRAWERLAAKSGRGWPAPPRAPASHVLGGAAAAAQLRLAAAQGLTAGVMVILQLDISQSITCRGFQARVAEESGTASWSAQQESREPCAPLPSPRPVQPPAPPPRPTQRRPPTHLVCLHRFIHLLPQLLRVKLLPVLYEIRRCILELGLQRNGQQGNDDENVQLQWQLELTMTGAARTGTLEGALLEPQAALQRRHAGTQAQLPAQEHSKHHPCCTLGRNIMCSVSAIE